MFAELPEAQATGREAEIYAAIRASSGVGMVSLCYRHLAARVGVLDWAWRVLGPDFVSGRCRELARGVVDGDVAALLAGAADGVPPPPSLPDDAVTGVRATIDAFNRANPLNFMFVGVLARLLECGEPLGDQVAPAPAPDDPGMLDPVLLDPVLLDPVLIDPVPPIIALDDMAPSLREMMLALGDLGIGKRDKIVPSLYRHVAHWPEYIAYIHGVLTRPGLQERLEEASYNIRIGLEATVDALFDDCAARDTSEGRPGPQARAEFQATLPSFPPRIPLMIATGHFLKGL